MNESYLRWFLFLAAYFLIPFGMVVLGWRLVT